MWGVLIEAEDGYRTSGQRYKVTFCETREDAENIIKDTAKRSTPAEAARMQIIRVFPTQVEVKLTWDPGEYT